MPNKPLVFQKIKDREGVEYALGELALRRRRIKSAEAGCQEEITAARARCDADTKGDREIATAIEERLESWAGENAAEFREKRSIDFLHGILGFHLGKRQLKTRSKWTWERVLEGLLNRMTDYVRRSLEVDKEKILRDADGENPVLSNVALETMGLRVIQEDRFFVELKEL